MIFLTTDKNDKSCFFDSSSENLRYKKTTEAGKALEQFIFLKMLCFNSVVEYQHRSV